MRCDKYRSSPLEARLVQLRVIQRTDSLALQEFLEWYGHTFSIKDLASDPDPKILVRHIRWAQNAKRYYVEFLKAAFCTTAQILPRFSVQSFDR